MKDKTSLVRPNHTVNEKWVELCRKSWEPRREQINKFCDKLVFKCVIPSTLFEDLNHEKMD